MKHPRVVVYERDGRLAQLLTEPVQSRRWALREPRQVDTCMSELREGSPAVIVVRLTTKLEQELSIIERTSWQFPQTRIIVVGDVENEALANLSWDLGASYVLFPPMRREQLPEIVLGLMDSLVAQNADAQAQPEEPGEVRPVPAQADRKPTPESRHA